MCSTSTDVFPSRLALFPTIQRTGLDEIEKILSALEKRILNTLLDRGSDQEQFLKADSEKNKSQEK